MNERINELINTLGMKKVEFARRLNVSQPFVSELCSGAKSPSSRTIADICREFDVNEDWLRTGEGDMYIKKLPTDEVAEYVSELLDNDESNPFYNLIIDMMRTYCNLDDKSKLVVKDFFAKLKENAQKKEGD